jgi:hypothetical protein
MTEHKRCPECESYNSEKVWTDERDMEFVVTRICNDCPTEWTVAFVEPLIRDVVTH